MARRVPISRSRNYSKGAPEGSRQRAKPAFYRELRFRPIRAQQIEEIMAIERASFSYPWSPQFFLQELRVSCARSLAAVIGEKSVGYTIFWFLPDEVDIHNLAVHPDYRRRGIGRSLLQAVIDEAKGRGASRVTLEVRKSNEIAQNLYRSLGFVTRGIRKGYYSDNGEDAVLMALELDH